MKSKRQTLIDIISNSDPELHDSDFLECLTLDELETLAMPNNDEDDD